MIISSRRTGKTTKMIDWLLAGHTIESYPGWSRVIVCTSTDEVIRLNHLVRDATKHLEGTFGAFPDHVLGNICKAVWHTNDIKSGLRGSFRDQVEIGVDQADQLLEQLLGTRIAKATFTHDGEVEIG